MTEQRSGLAESISKLLDQVDQVAAMQQAEPTRLAEVQAELRAEYNAKAKSAYERFKALAARPDFQAVERLRNMDWRPLIKAGKPVRTINAIGDLVNSIIEVHHATVEQLHGIPADIDALQPKYDPNGSPYGTADIRQQLRASGNDRGIEQNLETLASLIKELEAAPARNVRMMEMPVIPNRRSSNPSHAEADFNPLAS
jgi:hypothetical protein